MVNTGKTASQQGRPTERNKWTHQAEDFRQELCGVERFCVEVVDQVLDHPQHCTRNTAQNKTR
jgi:hypothetical protein